MHKNYWRNFSIPKGIPEEFCEWISKELQKIFLGIPSRKSLKKNPEGSWIDMPEAISEIMSEGIPGIIIWGIPGNNSKEKLLKEFSRFLKNMSWGARLSKLKLGNHKSPTLILPWPTYQKLICSLPSGRNSLGSIFWDISWYLFTDSFEFTFTMFLRTPEDFFFVFFWNFYVISSRFSQVIPSSIPSKKFLGFFKTISSHTAWNTMTSIRNMRFQTPRTSIWDSERYPF